MKHHGILKSAPGVIMLHVEQKRAGAKWYSIASLKRIFNAAISPFTERNQCRYCGKAVGKLPSGVWMHAARTRSGWHTHCQKIMKPAAPVPEGCLYMKDEDDYWLPTPCDRCGMMFRCVRDMCESSHHDKWQASIGIPLCFTPEGSVCIIDEEPV